MRMPTAEVGSILYSASRRDQGAVQSTPFQLSRRVLHEDLSDSALGSLCRWAACDAYAKQSQDPEPFEGRQFERLISDSMISTLQLSNCKMQVDRLVDPVPYTILEDLPAPRVYALFAKAGITTACVVSEKGQYKGIISRDGLIKAARNAEGIKA